MYIYMYIYIFLLNAITLVFSDASTETIQRE